MIWCILCRAGTSTVNGHYYTIAKSLLPNDTSLLDTAELFARLGSAQFDSNIVGWYIKFYYLFWRPVTAIRCAGSPVTCKMTHQPSTYSFPTMLCEFASCFNSQGRGERGYSNSRAQVTVRHTLQPVILFSVVLLGWRRLECFHMFNFTS